MLVEFRRFGCIWVHFVLVNYEVKMQVSKSAVVNCVLIRFSSLDSN